ncbi:hypothetical protein WHR41_03293 [Cladosporium halotolerans]|uniref:RRM domain-containing protein n=1 Tax=Cladosporium halotolerans TaxID=1052096 RepID=A0AB34KWS8_9PEZI
MADMDTYDNEPRTYDDYPRGGERSRSRSPGADRDGDTRIRDDPYNGRSERDVPPPRQNGGERGGDNSEVNPGSNLFVTGIHPRLTEEEITVLFEKHGRVEKCNIMRDPHTRESRGFGFVKMVASEDADAAKDALQGEVYEGRTLSIEKARRARPRTPTPGKYFGPPKRDDRPPRGGGYRDRYDDRGYGRRYDDRGPRGPPRDRYDDRGYGRRYDDGPRGDRYRDDRYGDRGDRGGDRRGGYGYDRPPRGPPAERSGYGAEPSGGAPPPARDYDDRRRYD